MNRIVIVGASGHARELADVVRARAEADGSCEFLGFVDDDPALADATLCDAPVLGSLDWLRARAGDVTAICGIGTPATRRRVVHALEGDGVRFGGVVHPRAEVTRFVRIGVGVVITAGCIVTNEIELGDHVHLNRSVNVGHDCRVGAFCHLAPGSVLSGNVTLGEGCDIGTGAVVIQGRSIGAWSIVGAAAAVIRNLPANVTAVGVPARVIEQRDAGWHA